MATIGSAPQALGPGMSQSNLANGATFNGNLDQGAYTLSAVIDTSVDSDGAASPNYQFTVASGGNTNTYQGSGHWDFVQGSQPNANVVVKVIAGNYKTIAIRGGFIRATGNVGGTG